LHTHDLGNFSIFFKDGVKAAYINPQFTTQTFPNHWSLATGSYIESHGIVANNFYDPQLKQHFKRENADYSDVKWWNSTVPLWYTAVKSGLKSASYFWPGSDAIFFNSTLYTRLPFDKDLKFEQKIDQTIKWFTEEDYKLVFLYHHQPDSVSHRYGVSSIRFNQTIRELDNSFGYMIGKLKSSGLYDSDDFNVILVSDHGMVNITQHVILDDYFNETDVQVWSENGNVVLLQPLIGLNELIEKLSKIPNTTVTTKNNINENLHYKNNHRVPDVMLTANEGVALIRIGSRALKNGTVPRVDYETKKKLFIKDSEKASHGFDTIYPSMRGIFMARGAYFKKNYQTNKHVENIDVYPLVCHILEIKCENRNGSIERVTHFLANKVTTAPNQSNKTLLDLFLIFIFKLIHIGLS
jgi:predicted AlkP superfamily pyrophosphatase or phosphodiesterase